MIQKEAKMSIPWRAACSALVLSVGWYAPEATAVKVTRDPSVSPAPQPPKPAQTTPTPAPPDLPKLTAEQIADRNATARGGVAAWRAVKTITLSGKLEAGGKVDTYLPYTLQMKRPNKQRLAIEFAGETAVQVYDGKTGWKLRPYLNRADPEPFSPEELRKTQAVQGFEGPLVDYASKGNKLELEGTETVEGKATYRLKLTDKEGRAHRVWVDGATFLDAKIEDAPRRFDGKMRAVETYLSDYRSVDGVVIPYLSETRVQGARAAHKMTVEKVALNSALDDALFVKPAPANLPPRRTFTMAPTTGATPPPAGTAPAAAAAQKAK
jgi:outer membrane lipoprotein-sorting protein